MTFTTLCADIGTSSLKAALIDLEGRVLAFHRQEYPVGRDRVGAEDWEAALELAIRRLSLFSLFSTFSAQVPAPQAVCVSGNGPTLVPVAPDGTPRPPLYWYDAGIPVPRGQSFFIPQALRLRNDRPADYEQAAMLFSAQEWLSYRLGADPVTVLPTPAHAPYYWDAEQCAEAGVAIEKFPPFVPMGSRIGRVSANAARRFGLPAGIPLVAGGPDFIMAVLGAGALETGLVCDRAGTSEGINLCAGAPSSGKDLRALPHVSPGLWNIGAVIPRSGRLFEWYRALTGADRRPYGETLADLIKPDGTLSEERGSVFFSPDARAPAGFTANCRGITDKASLGRGVLEALGFLSRDALDCFERHGFSITEMRVSGGQGKNNLWNQLKADITGCALLIPETGDGELAGDAILGALALGEVSGLAQGVERMIRIRRRYEPDPKRHAGYRARYAEYRAAGAQPPADSPSPTVS